MPPCNISHFDLFFILFFLLIPTNNSECMTPRALVLIADNTAHPEYTKWRISRLANSFCWTKRSH